MQQPKTEFITIDNNIEKISNLLNDLVLEPRIKALNWSKITGQTPNMKIGYPGQHLASLIVGMLGSKTGARGNDIVDGTEVKSCSRVDALDKCKECGEKVSRYEKNCSVCGSENISRDNTSKWLFTIRSERDLEVLLEDVDRVLLVLADYPHFLQGHFDTISFQAWEIWTKSDRCDRFSEIMTNYYNNIFLKQRELNPNKTPAPKNFWPYSYQFYLCNPVKVFSCDITNANTSPTIENIYYVQPNVDRETLKSEDLPSGILTMNEFDSLIHMFNTAPEKLLKENISEGKTVQDLKDLLDDPKLNNRKLKEGLIEILPFINEDLKEYLDLREDKFFVIATEHKRK